MKSIKKCAVLLTFLVFLVFSSCSAGIEGAVREGGAAEISLKTSLEPATLALIRSIRGFLGDAADTPVLDGPEISRSLAVSPGIRAVSLKNTGPSSLEGGISISNVGDFLASDDEKSRFITYTDGQGAGNSSLIIKLDRESAPFIIARLSAEAEEYLTALLAPVVLGEKCTRQEYLDLLAMIYRRPLADEIAAARILVSIEFPRQVTAVKGGNAAGKKAEFNIPLTDLLVLENPLNYEIRW